ncbi:protein transport protein SEC24 [Nematocida major]|uniref:protein transport protein SEC24 n=1 Tax=Nematocida major TaxID=1912982 RepID=UPI002007D833|nr:protein transport protein SEC24 [Nematocida major]KAH9386800.1 protein transport protein SEC24 [Nematocida major]
MDSSSGMASFGANTTENVERIISQIKSQEYTYTRCTFTSAPTKKADLKKTKIPFIVSATILPLHEQPAKRVEAIPRCTNCRAYLSMYCEVIPPGYKWRCALCRCTNDSQRPLHSYGGSLRVFSPSENAENNKRVSNNPVLTESILEFVSPSEKATPPAAFMVFIVECTPESVEKGTFSTVLRQIVGALEYLNDPHERARMCIMLVSSTVEIVRLCGETLEVDRINEVEGALPMILEEEYTAKVHEIRERLQEKVGQIEEYILGAPREHGNNFGLALKVLKRMSNRRAEVFGFLATPPSVKAGAINKPTPGLRPNNTFYENMAMSLLEENISVNLYILSAKTVEVPTLMPLVEKTGGYIRYYPAFIGHYSPDKEALRWDLIQHFSLDNGNNAYCRVRASNEVSIRKYWGVDVQNDGLIKLARLSRGKTISFEIEYDQDLVLEGLTIQIATIYTNSGGERVVRILNFSVDLGPVSIDILGIVHGIALKALDAEIAQKGQGIKTALAMGTSTIEFAGIVGAMAAFPIFMHALVKNKVFKNVSPDLRGLMYLTFLEAPMKTVDALIYPTLVRIGMEGYEGASDVVLPTPVRLSCSSITADGIYYLDSGIIVYIFIGNNVECNMLAEVQGRTVISPEDKDSEPIRNAMDYLVDGRVADPVTYIVHQEGYSFLLEGMQSMLLDDGASPVSSNYQEYYNRFLAKGYIK